MTQEIGIKDFIKQGFENLQKHREEDKRTFELKFDRLYFSNEKLEDSMRTLGNEITNIENDTFGIKQKVQKNEEEIKVLFKIKVLSIFLSIVTLFSLFLHDEKAFTNIVSAIIKIF